ncbi:hypothetical protein KY349_00155 [Candidatus Woesearchaeota archaeon]|nr:hypothetical protein [Candidatus Woesearchaeota archaeon]
MKKNKIAKKVAESIVSDIKSSNLFKLVSSSFKALFKRWPLLFASILVDFLFIFFLTGAAFLINLKLIEKATALMQLTGEMTGGMANALGMTTATSITQDAQFQSLLTSIFKNFLLLVLVSFFLWIIFQGISWFFAYRMSQEKNRLPFLIFWKNFALETIPFYIVYFLTAFITGLLAFRIGSRTASLLFIIITVLTFYFGSLCYTITNRYAYQNFKQCFIYGTKKFTKVIQSILFLIVFFFIIQFVFWIIFSLTGWALLPGIILIMPAIVFARILLFKTAALYWQPKKHVKKK